MMTFISGMVAGIMFIVGLLVLAVLGFFSDDEDLDGGDSQT